MNNPHKWTRGTALFFLIPLLVISIFIIVLGQFHPDADYHKTHPDTSTHTVTIILLDGLSQSIFQSELTEGNLPNLATLLDTSLYIINGIGSFPSMTGYAFYPFITGRDAVESGILGLRWFDRKRLQGNLRNYVGRTNIWMNKDIFSIPQNIFEIYDTFYTASINTYMNRGVHHSLKTGWAHTTAKYSQQSLFPLIRSFPIWGEAAAKNHFEHETLVTDLAIKQLEKNPKVQWITYPSLDAHNHVHGTDSIYFELLHHLDQEVGRIWQKVQQLQQDDRMIVVVTDHGVSDVDINLDIPKLLKDSLGISLERGPSTHLTTDQLDDPLSTFIDQDGYFVINGNLCAFLYLRNQTLEGVAGWEDPLPDSMIRKFKGHNLPLYLSNILGVDIVAHTSGENSIHIWKNGHATTLTKSDSLFTYQYEIDPFYKGEVKASDSTFNEQEYLDNSIHTEYPYALVRLYELLTQENSPDLVMTALPGYDLAADYEIFVDNYRGGHGGIRAELLRVPYLVFHPGRRAETVPYMLAEDVGKIVKSYLAQNK